MRFWLAALGCFAGLMGASGVALAAIGAHRSGNPNVTTAAYFLMLHAAALVGLVAAIRGRPTPLVLAAGSLITLGAILFSGDLALRALADVVLVRLAAPTGGVLLILGWLIAAVGLPLSLLRARPTPFDTMI